MSRRKITYLIAYDISDPRRLARVHRFLSEQAFAVQYSVFVATLDPRGIGRLLSGVARLINPTDDDFRAYPLPSSPSIDRIGLAQAMDEAVITSVRLSNPHRVDS